MSAMGQLQLSVFTLGPKMKEQPLSGQKRKRRELADALKASVHISLGKTSYMVKPDNGIGKNSPPQGAMASLPGNK